VLTQRHGISPNQTILLHLGSQFQYVTWFWSVIAAGAIPVVSTPLPVDATSREAHLRHLQTLLHMPTVLTTDSLASDLATLDNLEIIRSDTLEFSDESSDSTLTKEGYSHPTLHGVDNSVAFMMLTSGSTGGAKAVEISHTQAIAAIQGKIQMLGTSESDVLLNWIGK
jgi:acyl-CoA synthetase (AMP-forming)/AMP-acid ligase II